MGPPTECELWGAQSARGDARRWVRGDTSRARLPRAFALTPAPSLAGATTRNRLYPLDARFVSLSISASDMVVLTESRFAEIAARRTPSKQGLTNRHAANF